jgi:hypothetical protein
MPAFDTRVESLRPGTRFRGLIVLLGCVWLLAGLGVGAASANSHHHRARQRGPNAGRSAPAVHGQVAGGRT